MSATKVCTKCGEEKPQDEFYRASSGGRRPECKACGIAATKARRQRQRERMGEEAFLAHHRQIVRRSRERTGNESGKRYERAKHLAVQALIDRHRDEFDTLLADAKVAVS